MRLLRGVLGGLRALWRKEEEKRELDEEISEFIAAAAEEKIGRGMPPGEAWRNARLEFAAGGVEAVKDDVSDATWETALESIMQDLRYAVRMMFKNRGFTTVVVLSMALGIGANTAIFSLVDQVVLKWLPVPAPEQLVEFDHRVPALEYARFEKSAQSYSGMFAYDTGPFSAGIDGRQRMIQGKFVTAAYSQVMGLSAIVGRTIAREDDQPGQPRVCTLSEKFWKQEFGRSPVVMGKVITLQGIAFTVVGVVPEFGEGGSLPVDVLVPMAVHGELAMKDNTDVSIVGRLKQGIAPAQAAAEATLLYQQVLSDAAGSELTAAARNGIKDQRIALRPAARGGSRQFSTELRILASVVGLVLLLTCMNVANLMIARATSRRREIAVRLAIGASRRRLLQQLLTENILLAMLAGAAGLMLAVWFGPILWMMVSEPPAAIALDLRLVGFTAAISLLTGIVFGLLPALQSTKVDFGLALKQPAGSLHSSGGSSLRAGKALVVSQIALALMMLAGAGLLLRSLLNMDKVDVGFEQDHVLLLWAFPTMVGYDSAREQATYQRLLENLNSTPGIESATFSRLQLFSGYWARWVSVPGYRPASKDDTRVSCNTTAPGFFATMGIPLLQGRDFTLADRMGSAPVAIISESLARHYFHDEDPIGRHFSFTGSDGGDVQVVGLVRDVKTDFREERRNRSPRAAYIPFAQSPAEMRGQAVFELRTKAGAADMASVVRRELQSLDPNLPTGELHSQAEVVGQSVKGDRSLAALTGLFGLLALLLASIGLYGTISYSVNQRTREIGIRMALGAASQNVRNMVLREGLRLATAGIVAGLLLGAGVSRVIASQLYGVSAADPDTLSAVALMLMAVALAATYVPARRAMQVSPTVALRYE